MSIAATLIKRGSRVPLSRLVSAAVLEFLPVTLQLASAIVDVTEARLSGGNTAPMLKPRTQWFEPGQTGVTYAEVLGDYLMDERSVTVVDPHLKSFRQIRNLRELLLMVATKTLEPVEVHVVTSVATNSDNWKLGQSQALVELQEELACQGVKLTVEFDQTTHDRWIETSKGRIILGKGLDFWDARRSHGLSQQQREIGRHFSITYCPNPSEKLRTGSA